MPKDLSENSDIFKIQKRLRLYGKPSSKDLICREVVKLLLGDSKKHIEPLTKADIGRKLGYGRTQIHDYCKLAEKEGYIELDENQKAILPKIEKKFNWKLYNKKYPITNDPMFSIWLDKQKLKKGGDLKVLPMMVSMISKICNTCKITPTELIESKESAEKFKEAYLTAYQNGTSWGDTRDGALDTLDYRTSYAIGSFGGVHGVFWEKGTQAMSRKIVRHANYSDVRFSDEQFIEANKWILDNYGLDSDLYRWFWVGVETCARFQALKNMKLEWTVHKSETGKTTFIMEVIETKTKHIKNGKWTKFIRRPETQQSLELLKSKGGTRIYSDSTMNGKLSGYIFKQLRALFTYMGKDGYYLDHPSHVLRHLGAHRLLKKGNYTNHSLVASVGGWNVIDELIRSYGEIPPEVILQELDKWD